MFKSSAVLSALLSISAGTVMATEPGEIIPASEPGLIDADDLIEFASHYWHWYDTGVFTQEALSWTPSNPDVVRLDTHFFHEALVIFEDIYAGSLNNDLDSVNYYPIDDLLTDDPSVMSQFRAFTETGILTTRSGATSSETINHLLLILTATTTQDPCTSLRGNYTVTVSAAGGLVVSSSPKKTKIDCDNEPEPNPDHPDDLPPILEDLVHFPLLDCLPIEIFDMHDSWQNPGMDCDDYADALAEHLRRQLAGHDPEPEISQLWLMWYNGDGHVITMVKLDGQYYLIDAQTGETRGPYGSPSDAEDGAWDIMEDKYGVEKDDLFLPRVKKRDPEWRPLTEPNPWHTNPEILDLFDDAPCDPLDFVPPGSGGNPE